MAVPFELAETEDVKTVTIRLGLSTTANTGAANQTRLYIDNVRLLQLKELYDSVSLLPAGETSAKASAIGRYDLNGRPLKRLPASGFFIQDGHKVVR